LGCDAVEIDNLDSFSYSTGIHIFSICFFIYFYISIYFNLMNGCLSGFPLTALTALDYLLYLSNIAHSLNMAFALKNNGDLLVQYPSAVLPAADFAVVENGLALKEQASYAALIGNGKPVFNIEYFDNTGGCSPTVTASQKAGICSAAAAAKWFSVFKLCMLGAEYTVC
jgi:hypothetical protein